MGPFLGHKIAMKIIGGQGSDCLLDRFGLKSRPFYHGNPWFLPLVLMGYRFLDRFGR